MEMVELLAPMMCAGVMREIGTLVVLEPALEARIVAAGNAIFTNAAEKEFSNPLVGSEEEPVPEPERSHKGEKEPAPEDDELDPAQLQFGRGLEEKLCR